MSLPVFKSSSRSLGIELELQLIDGRTLNLTTDAGDLLRRVESVTHSGEIKPEITQSMIEINSSVHHSYSSLLEELTQMRALLTGVAQRMNLRIAGGGAHPFQRWNERRIYPASRFKRLSEQYGYLAKIFTVFGQHIHLGCANADEAVYLTRAFTRYLPQFIALSASSPYYQGADTSFDSSRLHVISAFPLTGLMPEFADWSGFEAYFAKMRGFGIVESMKDFYWDVRPKPEYGTVEIRINDTPLTVERAALLAVYARALADYLLEAGRHAPHPDAPLVYPYNRFQAARYGYRGIVVDPITGGKETLGRDILATLDALAPYVAPDAEEAMHALREGVRAEYNDAAWLRRAFADTRSLSDTVRLQSDLWMGLRRR